MIKSIGKGSELKPKIEHVIASGCVYGKTPLNGLAYHETRTFSGKNLKEVSKLVKEAFANQNLEPEYRGYKLEKYLAAKIEYRIDYILYYEGKKYTNFEFKTKWYGEQKYKQELKRESLIFYEGEL